MDSMLEHHVSVYICTVAVLLNVTLEYVFVMLFRYLKCCVAN